MIRLLAIACLVLAGCERAPRVDPPLFRYETDLLARTSAELHARDVSGWTRPLAATGSMEPLMHGGDWVVVAPTPFVPDKLLGRVLVYRPSWDSLYPTAHRAVAADSYGLIMSGDNNRPRIDADGRNVVSEAPYRVTQANYLGEVVGLYRVAK